MLRRKTRTMLTVFGITIGIFAFTVMGSMAEKINLLVSGGTKYYADKVTVSGSDSLFISAPLDIHKKPQIEKVDGVSAVSASVYTSLSEKFDAISFGPPASIVGGERAIEEKYETFKITYSAGRALKDDDNGKGTVGSDLVKKLSAKVGKMNNVLGQRDGAFCGLKKTLTAPDNTVVMALA